MAVSYNKLWKLMIDKKLKRQELLDKAGISHRIYTKMRNDKLVSMDSIEKICKALQCDVGDVMEFVPDENTETD